jgi:hypothetical protein
MELFDFINDVSHEKKNIFREISENEEKKYPSYLINRYFSFFPDTLFYANEMNKCQYVSGRENHHFYLYALRKKKRFTKWLKTEKIEEENLIMEAYSCSRQKAKEYLKILTPKQIENIKNMYHHLNTNKT